LRGFSSVYSVAMDTVSEVDWSRRMRPTTLTLDMGLGLLAADQVSDVVLSSPDVRLLKLESPELEKLVLQQYNNCHQQQQQQQQESSKLALDVAATEDYARGFVDALLELHAQRQTDVDSTVGPRTSTASFQTAAARSSVVNVTEHHPDFSQTVVAGSCATFCDTPPMSPADDADEERVRLERKRARNRLAAMRCRNRKLERIEQLQSQADRLRAANVKLANEVKQLRETVNRLRQDVLLHADCQLPARTSLLGCNA